MPILSLVYSPFVNHGLHSIRKNRFSTLIFTIFGNNDTFLVFIVLRIIFRFYSWINLPIFLICLVIKIHVINLYFLSILNLWCNLSIVKVWTLDIPLTNIFYFQLLKSYFGFFIVFNYFNFVNDCWSPALICTIIIQVFHVVHERVNAYKNYLLEFNIHYWVEKCA